MSGNTSTSKAAPADVPPTFHVQTLSVVPNTGSEIVIEVGFHENKHIRLATTRSMIDCLNQLVAAAHK